MLSQFQDCDGERLGVGVTTHVSEFALFKYGINFSEGFIMRNTRFDQGRKEEGQGLVEYSLILLMVAVATVAALGFFGHSVKDTYCGIMNELPFGGSPEDCGVSVVKPLVIAEGPNNLNLEADINDPDADPDDPYGRVNRVEFYIDSMGSSPVQIEHHHKYCLSGNASGQPCHNFDTSGLQAGDHIVTIKVLFNDGSTGTTTYTYSKQ